MAFNSTSAKLSGQKSSRKGRQNKSTERVKTAFANLLENNLDQLQSDLDSLYPKERIDAILKLANYVLPKIKEVSAEIETKQSNPVIISLGDGVKPEQKD